MGSNSRPPRRPTQIRCAPSLRCRPGRRRRRPSSTRASTTRTRTVRSSRARRWEQFTHDWAHAWRAKELEKILGWFAEDVRVQGPGAQELTGSALVEGKPALRAFWTKALLHDTPIVYEVEGFTWDPETNSLLLRYQSGPVGGAPHRAAALLRFGNGRTVIRLDAYLGA
jgi:hypothetical protein